MVKTIKHIILVLYGLTCVYPFLWMIGTSLKTSQDALANPQSPSPKGRLSGPRLQKCGTS